MARMIVMPEVAHNSLPLCPWTVMPALHHVATNCHLAPLQRGPVGHDTTVKATTRQLMTLKVGMNPLSFHFPKFAFNSQDLSLLL